MTSTLSWSARSRTVFPGGSLGEYNLPADLATVLTRGEGARVWDADGREYIDLTMGWGSLLLGHAHASVVKAVQERAALGSNFAYVNQPALELAEEMVRAIPCAQRVRFCASGTEATMYALRLARAFSSRPKVLKFEGAYHGANETGVMSLFPRRNLAFPQAEPTSAGIDPAAARNTLIAPYNDLETTAQILNDHSGQVAAVIVEPLHRCTLPQPGFLQGLHQLTRDHNVLLLFDEVVTGFRLAYGGAQEYYGVTPDLAAYGKGLGGGYPMGAIAGRADILELVNEARLGADDYVWFASSAGGNPVTAAAALATLHEMRRPHVYQRFFAIGQRLRTGLRDILAELDIAAQVLGDGPLCAVAFTDKPITDYRSAQRADSAKARAFTLGLFANGVFLNPMSTKFYVSLAHTDTEIDRVLEIARGVLRGEKFK
ncbi:MAG: aspartate aminotransferase family protein [Caldilineaceae bacterium]